MIPSDIRAYLKQKHAASLADLVQHFGVSSERISEMLEYWQRKGYVQTYEAGCSKGCGHCASASKQMYQWQAQPAQNLKTIASPQMISVFPQA